ncbi:MAG: hypothetical protein ACXWP0_01220 [Ktedonobacterales bacterium]
MGTSKAIKAVVAILALAFVVLTGAAIVSAPEQDRPAIILITAVVFGAVVVIGVFTYRLSKRP